MSSKRKESRSVSTSGQLTKIARIQIDSEDLSDKLFQKKSEGKPSVYDEVEERYETKI